MKFTKMHGCGNDYVYFNCMDKELDDPASVAIKVSDRHKGVGGDGIVMICSSNVADAKMRMFNIDGSEGKMCGNAIRCVAKYVYDNNIVRKDTLAIETLSGIKMIDVTVKDGEVTHACVDMEAPILKPKDIPVNIDGDTAVKQKLTVDGKEYEITCVSMGNPHCVIFCDDVANLPLNDIGPKFEKHDIFPENVNTEFVKVINSTTLEMRVYERGSGETQACGTGACATVVAAVLAGHCEKNQDVTVKLLGGDLTIKYTDETVFMTGPATKSFEGTL